MSAMKYGFSYLYHVVNAGTYKLLHTGLLLIFSAGIWAQQTSVTVIDDQSSEPCMYANVVLTDDNSMLLQAGVTDEKGKVVFDLDRTVNMCVSYVGYQTVRQSLQPGEDPTIRLETDVLSMEAVVVTGQHRPRPVDKSIYKIDVVDSRIMQERGVNNLAEALSNETSIRMSVDPSTGTSIELQGLGGENIKYLVDGVPLVGRVRGDIDLEQINMENVDHIEIVKGPMSVQYGTSAIAGVVNIITRQNSYFRNVAKANSYMDSKGTYNFGIYGSAIRGKHTFTLSGNRNLFQGQDIDLNVDESDPDGKNRYMEFKPKRVYNADLTWGYRKDNFRMGLKSQFMNSLIKNYSNYTEGVSVLAYDTDYYTNRSTNSLTVADQLSEKLSYDIIGAYTLFARHSYLIESDLHLLTREVIDTTQTRFNNVMTRGNLTWAPADAFSLMTGWDLTWDNGYGDKIEDGARMGDYALYVSFQYDPLSVLSIQPGLRVIYNSIYGAPVIPSMNLQWSVFDNLGFRISYARGFRAPSLKELYLDFRDSNHNLSGNTDLKAETTNSYNASLDYRLSLKQSRLGIEPSVFYNDGKDAITLIVTDQETNSATNVNLGGRRTLGGEVNLSYRHLSGLSAGAGFSRIGETFDSEGEGDYLPLVFYSNYAFNTRYSFRKLRLVVTANLKYYGKTPALAMIPETEGGGYYRVYTDPYGDLELTATKTLWKNRLTLVAGVKNLLDNYGGRTYGYRDYGQNDYQYEYASSLNYGRTWFLKLNLRLFK